ncbi:hypothetical protein J2I47_07900 [Fibrella sp. HMF5335]|uniref:Uncharacterized protein n=1 Tax=Fibrella rubiginis TaxID=2817060 RepID=A0A939GGP1_9BACT|nr:hypothetical protein [Fibrella rubiginis]MBO0936465.1 hypothetical protein [Fibrella rubiginis]
MALLSFFRRLAVQDPTEARRRHNYENALNEVRRTNQAQQARAQEWAKLDRLIGQQLEELIQEVGPNSLIVQTVQEVRQNHQQHYERSQQDAERRLVGYRNIILKQGRS